MTRPRWTICRLMLAACITGDVSACSGPTTPAEAAGTVADTSRRTPDTVADPNVAPQLVMRNVQFRFTKDVVVGIDRIRAQMRPAPPAEVVTFDDPSRKPS